MGDSKLVRHLRDSLGAALESIRGAMYLLEEVEQTTHTRAALKALDEASRQLRIQQSYEKGRDD